jgi:hypothetical protein
MFLQRKWFFVLTAFVLMGFVLGIQQVLADASTSKPEPAVSNDRARNSELDPEVSILGETQEQNTDPNVDSEGNPMTASPVPILTELVEETMDIQKPQATTATYFKRYSGVDFQPRDSDTGYDYFGSGCISSKGSDYFVLDVQLPSNAEIDFVRLYYYDTSSANARMYLTWYDGAGGYSDVMYIDSSGTSGYGSAGAFTSYMMDPVNQSVALVWRPNTTGSSMALCGARIRYQVPLGVSYLPVLTKDTVGE